MQITETTDWFNNYLSTGRKSTALFHENSNVFQRIVIFFRGNRFLGNFWCKWRTSGVLKVFEKSESWVNLDLFIPKNFRAFVKNFRATVPTCRARFPKNFRAPENLSNPYSAILPTKFELLLLSCSRVKTIKEQTGPFGAISSDIKYYTLAERNCPTYCGVFPIWALRVCFFRSSNRTENLQRFCALSILGMPLHLSHDHKRGSSGNELFFYF